MDMKNTLNFKYILSKRKSYQKQSPFVIESTVRDREKFNSDKYCPRLLLWDPMQQYPSLKINCPHHDVVLNSTDRWSGTKHSLPRRLYDIHGCVFLVACKYRCESAEGTHFQIASDEGILNQVKDQGIDIPFSLQHVAGVTTKMLNYIIHR